MKVKVQVVIESDCGETEIIQEIAQLQPDTLHPETLGLTLAEAKTVLQNMQQKLVATGLRVFGTASHLF